MKCQMTTAFNNGEHVAPLVGAWIEIADGVIEGIPDSVAPLVGAWIEICIICSSSFDIVVAPLVGAWIEINIRTGKNA